MFNVSSLSNVTPSISFLGTSFEIAHMNAEKMFWAKRSSSFAVEVTLSVVTPFSLEEDAEPINCLSDLPKFWYPCHLITDCGAEVLPELLLSPFNPLYPIIRSQSCSSVSLVSSAETSLLIHQPISLRRLLTTL